MVMVDDDDDEQGGCTSRPVPLNLERVERGEVLLPQKWAVCIPALFLVSPSLHSAH